MKPYCNQLQQQEEGFPLAKVSDLIEFPTLKNVRPVRSFCNDNNDNGNIATSAALKPRHHFCSACLDYLRHPRAI
jgi:hypothetical protein